MTIFAPPGSDGSPVSVASRYDNFIGGPGVPPVNGQYFENVTPVTGRAFTEHPRRTPEKKQLAQEPHTRPAPRPTAPPAPRGRPTPAPPRAAVPQNSRAPHGGHPARPGPAGDRGKRQTYPRGLGSRPAPGR